MAAPRTTAAAPYTAVAATSIAAAAATAAAAAVAAAPVVIDLEAEATPTASPRPMSAASPGWNPRSAMKPSELPLFDEIEEAFDSGNQQPELFTQQILQGPGHAAARSALADIQVRYL